MNEAIRTRNPWRTAAMVLIAVLVLLVVALVSMLQPAATTGSGGPAVHANSAEGDGGAGIANDPFIDRHAEVVARYHQGNPR